MWISLCKLQSESLFSTTPGRPSGSGYSPSKRYHHPPVGFLVGSFNPFEKCESKWESSPSRGENKQYLKPPPRLCLKFWGAQLWQSGGMWKKWIKHLWWSTDPRNPWRGVSLFEGACFWVHHVVAGYFEVTIVDDDDDDDDDDDEWMMMNDDEWWWMMMNDDEWWWMMMNDDEWWWMMMNDDEWWWMMMNDDEW